LKYLITGCYGFLGYSTAMRLLEMGHEVIGLDRLVDAQSEKGMRVRMLARMPQFDFHECDLSNIDQLMTLFKLARPEQVMHFAAQYSVPASPKAAQSYAKSNCHGFINIISATQQLGLQRFHYASSTFVEEGFRPTSMYGATKQFNEDWANVYSNSFGMTTVGIRYGSTFGPWCRNDVGIYTQTKRILTGAKMKVSAPFHYQTAFLERDDAVEATIRLMAAKLEGHNTFTVVANDHRHDLGQIVRLIEGELYPLKANCDWVGYTDKGPGGIPTQLDKLRAAIGWVPNIKVAQGVRKFVLWAMSRHQEGKL
jgi:UDP-glucuronate 4-epimerase